MQIETESHYTKLLRNSHCDQLKVETTIHFLDM